MYTNSSIWHLEGALLKTNKNKLILLLCLIVFISLFVLTILDYNKYRDIIKEDILNITRLISTNIYAEIRIELIKPIFVSLTMANDQFLRDWVVHDNESDPDIIQQYLSSMRNKYGYDSVFFVSDITKNYYHQDKILKQISVGDAHDIWYYDLIGKDVEYDLDVDTDQAAQDELTFFVNCLIHDNDKLLGVTGVGVKMAHISQILHDYNQRLDVDVQLVSPDGTVQIDADENVIRKENVFDEPIVSALMPEILAEKQQLKIFELGSGYQQEFLISYYIEELDWYLIVRKDTNILRQSLKDQIVRESIIFIVAFLIIAFMYIKIVSYYQNKNIKLASTDMLTDLNNRMAFDQYLTQSITDAAQSNNQLTLIMLDIDNFKSVNDTYGHIEGDHVLKAIAQYLRKFIRQEDVLARWGGDEYAMIFKCAHEDANRIIDRIKASESQSELIAKYNISLSIGSTQYQHGDSAQDILKRADQALYMAKSQGKDRIYRI